MKDIDWSPPARYGCSPEELAEIEARQGALCPARYAEVLAKFGKVLGFPEEGDYWSYPEILLFKDEVNDLLRDLLDPISLPEDAFVISMYLEGQFMFVCASEGDDPPVRGFLDGHPKPTVAYPSVSMFMERGLSRLINPTGRESQAYYRPFRVEHGKRTEL
jgi:hypothetical protein